mgnify:CR=1 FL=1
MLKWIKYLIQPFRLVSHRNISEQVSRFFQRNPFVIYIVSFLLTLIIVYFVYR